MTLIKGCLINLSNRLPVVRKQTTGVRLEPSSGGLPALWTRLSTSALSSALGND